MLSLSLSLSFLPRIQANKYVVHLRGTSAKCATHRESIPQARARRGKAVLQARVRAACQSRVTAAATSSGPRQVTRRLSLVRASPARL